MGPDRSSIPSGAQCAAQRHQVRRTPLETRRLGWFRLVRRFLLTSFSTYGDPDPAAPESYVVYEAGK